MDRPSNPDEHNGSRDWPAVPARAGAPAKELLCQRHRHCQARRQQVRPLGRAATACSAVGDCVPDRQPSRRVTRSGPFGYTPTGGFVSSVVGARPPVAPRKKPAAAPIRPCSLLPGRPQDRCNCSRLGPSPFVEVGPRVALKVAARVRIPLGVPRAKPLVSALKRATDQGLRRSGSGSVPSRRSRSVCAERHPTGGGAEIRPVGRAGGREPGSGRAGPPASGGPPRPRPAPCGPVPCPRCRPGAA